MNRIHTITQLEKNKNRRITSRRCENKGEINLHILGAWLLGAASYIVLGATTIA
jgi:hypothetical protein